MFGKEGIVMKKQHLIKKMLCKSLIAGILITAFFVEKTPAFAMDVDGDLTYEEGAIDYIPVEMRQREAEKIQALRRMRNAYPIENKLSITAFKQETGWYCGPATVKQVVNRINGSSLSQDEYAALLGTTEDGTDMKMIPGVINTCIDERYYVYSAITTQKEWMERIRISIYFDRPAVLDINTESLFEQKKFPYSTKGHFINVSGYSDTEGVVYITDPHPNFTGTAEYSQDILYSANTAHFRKAIVW